ncbi:MAG: hypothetical protein FWE06_07510 [Oscillospiraceae bacterium]|nr:hypothetical protein [Oscillospiraceae bacterium]
MKHLSHLVNAPPALHYEKVETESFLFVNGPEPIEDYHLADKTNKSIYSGIFGGTATLYYEHNNETGHGLYYGFHFHNRGTTPVTLTLLNNGASVGWTTNCETWRRYYEFSGSGMAYTIAPNASMWLFFTKAASDSDTPSCDGEVRGGARSHTTTFDAEACLIPPTTFDGVWKAHTDGLLELRVLTFATPDLDSFDPLATECIDSQTHEGNTGWSAYAGALKCHMLWRVDDTTPNGNLPVTVNGKVFDNWTTCSTDQQSNVLLTDNIPLTIYYKGEPYTLTHDNIDPRTGAIWSWANWGILYQNEYIIRNNGSRSRTIKFYMKSTATANRYMGTYSPLNGGFKAFPFSDINNWLNGDQVVIQTTVQPDETAIIPFEYVLGGQSFGGVGMYAVVGD